MSYQKSHVSPIAKITLWNIAAKSDRLSERLDKYDKASSPQNFSPPFKRTWTYSPSKRLKHVGRMELKHDCSPSKDWFNDKMVDNYIERVLQEFSLEDLDRPEKRDILKLKAEKNVFDKFFEENGDEEEQRLFNYVKNCGLYE